MMHHLSVRSWPLAAALLALPAALPAQNSAYGVLGIGFPASPLNVVSRAMGGGNAVVDPRSLLNPAAMGLVSGVQVQAASMQEYRRFSVGNVAVTGLSQNRFPYVAVAASLGPRMSYGLGFTQYAERTFDVASTDTLTLRGAPVQVTDHTGSTGAVVDLQAGMAFHSTDKASFGIAGHVLGGSAKVTTSRTFADPFYRPFTETVDARFKGFGVSAGVVATPSTRLRVGAAVRVDTRLRREVDEQIAGDIKLPVSITGGLQFTPSPLLRVAGNVAWRSWSNAGSDLASLNTRAFNTLETGLGFDIGGAPVPVRFGVRYAQLPFSATAEQPHELTLSAGTGVSVSGDRAHIDASIERVMRDGGGIEERAWLVTVGFLLRP